MADNCTATTSVNIKGLEPATVTCHGPSGHTGSHSSDHPDGLHAIAWRDKDPAVRVWPVARFTHMCALCRPPVDAYFEKMEEEQRQERREKVARRGRPGTIRDRR